MVSFDNSLRIPCNRARDRPCEGAQEYTMEDHSATHFQSLTPGGRNMHRIDLAISPASFDFTHLLRRMTKVKCASKNKLSKIKLSKDLES